MKKVKSIKNKNGFTLVEMIVVISIMGMLSSIGVTKFGEVQAKSKITADCVTAQNIVQAYEIAEAEGVVTSDTSDIISKLVDKNYMRSEPIPQSGKDGDKFEINVDDKGQARVKVGTQEFYPNKPSSNKTEQ